MKLAACYVRVSTDDQTTSNQRAEVEQLARARGYEPRWYEETASAAKQRPVFDAMMKDVRRGEVSAVVVWSLDRLHRNLVAVVRDVSEFDRLHVRTLSVREEWLDSSGAMRGLLISVFGWVAEFERSRLIERTKAGLERARREGRVGGRPRAAPTKLAIAVEGIERGKSVTTAARVAGVSPSTLRRALAQKGFRKEWGKWVAP